MLDFDDVAAPTGSRSWGRVVAGAAVDLLLVICPTLIALGALHERFPFLSGGEPGTFGPVEQARIDEIDRGFSRAFETDEALYVLSGSGWWLSLGILVLVTVTVYVVVPAAARLRTPGMLLLRVPGTVAPDPAVEVVLDLTGPVDETARDESNDQAAEDEQSDGEQSEEHTAEADTSDENTELSEDGDEMVVDVTPEIVDISEDETAGDDELSSESGSTVEDIDITERQPIRPITLADEEDYRQWDREFGAPQPVDSSSISVTPPGFDALALPESSMSEAPLTAATLVKARSSEPTGASGPATTTPVWNEDWNAWLYWDGQRQRWFRHDPDSGRWAPLA